jgi:hypothetical protein
MVVRLKTKEKTDQQYLLIHTKRLWKIYETDVQKMIKIQEQIQYFNTKKDLPVRKVFL